MKPAEIVEDASYDIDYINYVLSYHYLPHIYTTLYINAMLFLT